jgi:hypothetical protein
VGGSELSQSNNGTVVDDLQLTFGDISREILGFLIFSALLTFISLFFLVY